MQENSMTINFDEIEITNNSCTKDSIVTGSGLTQSFLISLGAIPISISYICKPRL